MQGQPQNQSSTLVCSRFSKDALCHSEPFHTPRGKKKRTKTKESQYIVNQTRTLRMPDLAANKLRREAIEAAHELNPQVRTRLILSNVNPHIARFNKEEKLNQQKIESLHVKTPAKIIEPVDIGFLEPDGFEYVRKLSIALASHRTSIYAIPVVKRKRKILPIVKPKPIAPVPSYRAPPRPGNEPEQTIEDLKVKMRILEKKNCDSVVDTLKRRGITFKKSAIEGGLLHPLDTRYERPIVSAKEALRLNLLARKNVRLERLLKMGKRVTSEPLLVMNKSIKSNISTIKFSGIMHPSPRAVGGRRRSQSFPARFPAHDDSESIERIFEFNDVNDITPIHSRILRKQNANMAQDISFVVSVYDSKQNFVMNVLEPEY